LKRSIIIIAAATFSLSAMAPRIGSAADVAAGAKVAARRCAQCHGSTGMGDGKALHELNITVKPIPWPNKAEMAKFSDPQLTQIITLGGKGVGKSGSMPKFQNKLSEEQISDVVAYIRSLAM
jgi:mono/diheme cytochrome c family protein